jgi:ferredoxin
MDSDVKTFRDLMKEVQKYNFCGKCGGCVSFCSADNLGALELDQMGCLVSQMKRNASIAVSVTSSVPTSKNSTGRSRRKRTENYPSAP